MRAEFNHVSAEQIRAAVAPHLGEGFFAIDLADARAAVAKLPWVERAEARKRWPDAIELTVYEQQPYARWGNDRLINRHGKVFSVAGAEGLQGLPELSGPDDRLEDVIRFHADCLKEFSGSGLIVTAVALSPRGGWKLTLANGAQHRGRPRSAARTSETFPRCVAEARRGPQRHAGVCRSALRQWICVALGQCARAESRAGCSAGATRHRRTGLRKYRLLARACRFAHSEFRIPTPGFPHMNRKSEKNLIVGLDVGTSKIVAIVGEHAPGEAVEIIGIGSHPAHGLKRGVVVDIESTVHSIQRAVEEAELMAGCQIRSVYASIAGSHIKDENSHGTAPIRDKEVSVGDLDQVLNSAKAVAIPADRSVLYTEAQEYVIDGQEGIRHPVGMSGVRLEANVHLVTGAASAIQNITKCINRCGLAGR